MNDINSAWDLIQGGLDVVHLVKLDYVLQAVVYLFLAGAFLVIMFGVLARRNQ